MSPPPSRLCFSEYRSFLTKPIFQKPFVFIPTPPANYHYIVKAIISQTFPTPPKNIQKISLTTDNPPHSDDTKVASPDSPSPPSAPSSPSTRPTSDSPPQTSYSSPPDPSSHSTTPPPPHSPSATTQSPHSPYQSAPTTHAPPRPPPTSPPPPSEKPHKRASVCWAGIIISGTSTADRGLGWILNPRFILT